MRNPFVFDKRYINLFKFYDSQFSEKEISLNIGKNWVPLSNYKANNSENNLLERLQHLKKVKVKGGNSVYLPFHFTKDLLYIIGIVTGDGSLPIKYNGNGKRNYKISIQMKNYPFLYYIASLFKRVFKINPSFSIRRKKGREYLEMYVYSKLIYKFFSIVFEIPEGKKSAIVRMPSVVRNLKPLERLPFIAGIVDTDWGIAGNSFGTHCASLPLIQDVIYTISDLAPITFSPIKEFTQRGKYKSYQTRIRKRDFHPLLRVFEGYYPLKNKERVIYLRRGIMPGLRVSLTVGRMAMRQPLGPKAKGRDLSARYYDPERLKQARLLPSERND